MDAQSDDETAASASAPAPGSPNPNRRRRSRGEVLEALVSLFGSYSGAIRGSPRATATPSTASRAASVGYPASSVDDDGREELAVDAAVRVHAENARLRALVESTAQHLQRSLAALHERAREQQRAAADAAEHSARRDGEVLALRRELDEARSEAAGARSELEVQARDAAARLADVRGDLARSIAQDASRADAAARLERELAVVRQERADLLLRLSRLTAEADAQESERARELERREKDAQVPASQARAELAVALRRCSELSASVAHLTADKDRLALLVGRGRLLASQHFIGDEAPPGHAQHWLGGVGTGAPGSAGEGASVLPSAARAEWKDAPSWVPVGVVEACAAFRAKYPSVDAREMRDFLVACNSVWHSRLQAVSDGVEREAAKKSQWRAPYREVLQASTITRLRATIATLQALLEGRRPGGVHFAAASADLPRLTPGEEVLLQSGGAGADAVAWRTRRLSTHRLHAQQQHVSTEARLLSVPGSGARRLDSGESQVLLGEAMRCIEHLSRRLDEESAYAERFEAQRSQHDVERDETLRLGDAGSIYARKASASTAEPPQIPQPPPPPPPPHQPPAATLTSPADAVQHPLHFDADLLNASVRSPRRTVGDAIAAAQSPPRVFTRIAPSW
jgi:hypothetical protein